MRFFVAVLSGPGTFTGAYATGSQLIPVHSIYLDSPSLKTYNETRLTGTEPV